jgi:protein-tyrosine-phosphatase/predicted ATP-grasp superfamily ATP-dependent carboligase
MKEPVLILGGSVRIAITIARSLNRNGIPVDWAALSGSSPKAHSRAVREFFVLPSFRRAPENFLHTLSKLLEKGGYDLVVPGNDSALSAIAQHYDWLTSRVQLACPRPEIIHRILDKISILEAAKLCDIPIPATLVLSDVSEIKGLRDRLNFPVVVKPRSVREENAFQVSYFQTFEKLEQVFGSGVKGEFLVQEYFSGEGVGIELLMHDGDAIAVFQHRRLKELPSTGGVSVLAASEPVDPTLAKYGVEILRHLAWEGVAMVEFRARKADARAVLMEINGRFWGSIFLPVHAGIDFPYYVWQLAHDEQPQVPDYTPGVRVRWTVGEVRRLEDLFTNSADRFPPKPSAWKELVRFGRDLLPPTRDALWSIRDPLPAIVELGQEIKSFLLSTTKACMRRWAPRRIVDLVRNYRKLGGRDGLLYLKLQLFRALHVRHDELQRESAELHSVLFVCHGNIIRSPMAAALLQHYLPDNLRNFITISSAGLHAKPERGADARALGVAKAFGISLDDHRAQRITDELVKSSEAIFVMDYLNEAKLLGQYPEAQNKVFLLHPSPDESGLKAAEIEDPYDGDATDIHCCYEKLQPRVRQLAALLARQMGSMIMGDEKRARYTSYTSAFKVSGER